MKKIDIHCHTTDRTVKDVVDGDATVGNILKYMDEHDVEKTVLLASYFPHKMSGISNFHLLHWLSGRCSTMIESELRRFLMFGSLDFEHYFYQGLNELTELAYEGLIKGIKIYTGYQEIHIHDTKMGMVLDLAEKHGFPVMFHAGYSYACQRKYGTDTVAGDVGARQLRKLAEVRPAINFIFSHMSKPHFHQMLFAAKELPNVYTDMSGIIDSKFDEKEIPVCVEEIRLFLNECGPEKLLFGTDYPVQTHEHSVHFVEAAMKGFKGEDKAKVYYENAAKLLGLE